ncbi:MAG: hypothetical protein ACXABY_08070 [Candidatus Thorarchaeota archaeon]|jgi:hypothetical protein
MPLVKDLYNREWDGKKIGWINTINNARMAEYSWKRREGRMKLVYDKRHGMYDYKGRHIKEPAFEKRAVLINPKAKNGWEHFPNTEDAQNYRWSLTFTKKSYEVVEEVKPTVTIIK